MAQEVCNVCVVNACLIFLLLLLMLPLLIVRLKNLKPSVLCKHVELFVAVHLFQYARCCI